MYKTPEPFVYLSRERQVSLMSIYKSNKFTIIAALRTQSHLYLLNVCNTILSTRGYPHTLLTATRVTTTRRLSVDLGIWYVEQNVYKLMTWSTRSPLCYSKKFTILRATATYACA